MKQVLKLKYSKWRSANMKIHGYGYLWNVLSLFGINLYDVSRLNSFKTVLRFLLKSPIFILYAAAIFYTLPNLILATKNGIFEIRGQITWMFVGFFRICFGTSRFSGDQLWERYWEKSNAFIPNIFKEHLI